MSRRPLHAALSLALGCATWAGLTFAQSPAPLPAQSQAVQTLTVAEPGRPSEKCALLQAWRLADGSPAMKVKSLATGEIMTLVEPVQSTATKDPFRVYRWGKSVVPPRGSPVPPQEAEKRDESPERKWPSAHETVKTPTKTRSATTAAAPRTQPSTPSAAPRSQSRPTESQPHVAVPTPPEPWKTSTSTDSNRKGEATRFGDKQPDSKRETTARLASAVTAPMTPVSPVMDRNPAMPASTPVAPAASAAASLAKAPEPPSPPPPPSVSSSKPAPSASGKPAGRTGSSEDRPAKKTEIAQAAPVAQAVQRVVPDKPAERLSAPAAPEEPGIVSRSKPAVSLLPSEPPTPILQVGASVPSVSTSRPISRPAPTAADKPPVNAKHDPAAALDIGQVVSRAAPALSAYGGPVTPRRIGSDPLANPDQYVRLNKRDRDERTPLPANSTLPSSALQVEHPAKPAGATTAKAAAKVEPAPVATQAPTKETAKVAMKPPASKPAPEPKREVVQASSKEVKPAAPKVERPEPPALVAAVSAPPPPALERVEKQKGAPPVKQSTPAQVAKRAPTPAPGPQSAPKETRVAAASPVANSEIRQVALMAPALAQMVKPMPAADLSTLQGMADLIKVLSDSGVAAHRQKAATELGTVDADRHPYVVAALTSAAKRDDTAQVRVAAIHSLKQMRSDSPTVKAAFEAGIADTDPRVREAATDALRTFPEKRPTIQPVTGFTP